jgi:hypothetical protein
MLHRLKNEFRRDLKRFPDMEQNRYFPTVTRYRRYCARIEKREMFIIKDSSPILSKDELFDK